jgi:hypothetical protein
MLARCMSMRLRRLAVTVVGCGLALATLPPLNDQGCSVNRLVAGLLPSRAAGTVGAVADC